MGGLATTGYKRWHNAKRRRRRTLEETTRWENLKNISRLSLATRGIFSFSRWNASLLPVCKRKGVEYEI